jgi:hypothetical protein
MSKAFSPTSAGIKLNAGEQALSNRAAVEAQGQSRTHDASWGIGFGGADR